jgi:uroporphyrin-3 C-methyltransferase
VNPIPPPSEPSALGARAVSAEPLEPTPASASKWRWVVFIVGVAGVIASVSMAWRAEQRVASVEQELVRRQQDSAGQSNEARMLAKQAQQGMLDAAAKVALLEARVAEVAVQRGQLEELIQSLSRSRDENLVVDIEAAIRVALQQAAITGSAEPLVATLKQSDERLARYSQPRLEGIRRAIARDLDSVRAISVTDIATLTIKLDEAVRMIDDLPLLATALPRKEVAEAPPVAPGAPANARASASAAPPKPASSVLFSWDAAVWSATAQALWQRVWSEVKSLVRVTRIDDPDAMLLAPEQAFFLKENLKLRLLNARLALLSRQFETAQSDLTGARSMIERFFDKSSKRTALTAELVAQVAAQARQVRVPRPDDTLAALAAAAAGR